MDRNFQHRLSKIEKFVSTALKERKAKANQALKAIARPGSASRDRSSCNRLVRSTKNQ